MPCVARLDIRILRSGIALFNEKTISASKIDFDCTAVIMAFPHEFWSLADWNEAQLIGYITPKTLERRFPEVYAGISREDGED